MERIARTNDSVLDALIRVIESRHVTKIKQGTLDQFAGEPRLKYLALTCMEYSSAKVSAESSNGPAAIVEDNLTNPRNPDRFVYSNVGVGTKGGHGLNQSMFQIPSKGGIRLLQRKTERHLDEAIEEAADEYYDWAKLDRRYTNNVFVPNLIEVPQVRSIDDKVNKKILPLDRLRKLAKECAQELSRGGNYGITTIEVHEEVRRMANSEGTVIRDGFFGYMISFEIETRGNFNEVLVFNDGLYSMDKEFSDREVTRLINRAKWMSREVNKRKEHSGVITEGLYPTLLTPDAMCVPLHEALVHFLSSDEILNGDSKSWGWENFGRVCTNPHISVYSNPNMENRWGSMEHDYEGVPAKRRTLIENGMPVGYLADRNGAFHLSRLTGKTILPGDSRIGYPRDCSDATSEPRVSNMEVRYDDPNSASSLEELRNRFLKYMKKNGHKTGIVIPRSSSGWCEDDGILQSSFQLAYAIDQRGNMTPVRYLSTKMDLFSMLNNIVEMGGREEYNPHRCGIDERLVRAGITCKGAIVDNVHIISERPEGLRQPPLRL